MAPQERKAQKQDKRSFKTWSDFKNAFFPREEARRIAESDPYSFGAALAERPAVDLISRPTKPEH
jgi:hypothetical protein